MEEFTATRREWQALLAVMPSLANPSIRPAVIDRIVELLGNDDAAAGDDVTLSLDDACAVAVHRARHLLSRENARTEEASLAIAEAEAIIRDHQRRV
ncbi:MAG: hypothetical protein ACR2J8_06805 [Thermomicrobiales bacterium]